MVTPLPRRRRPEILAKQVVTLDHLSRGRMVIGSGPWVLTVPQGLSSSRFGEEADDRTRAAMLDEGIDVLQATVAFGEPASASAVDHYSINDGGSPSSPRPSQRPTSPCCGWPVDGPTGDRYVGPPAHQGVVLIQMDEPGQLRQAADEIAGVRGSIDGFDLVVVRGPDSDPTPWEEAGATWWLTQTPYTTTADEVMARARAGPPRG